MLKEKFETLIHRLAKANRLFPTFVAGERAICVESIKNSLWFIMLCFLEEFSFNLILLGKHCFRKLLFSLYETEKVALMSLFP